MTARPSLDWRRWIAMLCIALAAVFAFDVTDAAMACGNAECTAACDMGACDDHGDQDSAEHHCCHGTVASQPSVASASITQASVLSEPLMREEFVPSGTLDALERPPRAFTAI